MIVKESEAWFELAEWFEPSMEEFLCFAISDAKRDEKISPDVAGLMWQRIQTALGVDDDDCVSAYSEGAEDEDRLIGSWDEGHEARVLAALMFGWEAKSEGR